MHTRTVVVAAIVVLSSTLSLAQPRGEIVIQQHTGRAIVGRIISETAKGYLVATSTGTELVEFTSIADIRQLAPVAAPVGAPVAQASLAPAPQPRRAVPQPVPVYVDEPASEAAEVHDVVEPARPRTSQGFHFGLGASLAVQAYRIAPDVGPQATASFEFNFGRPAYRINANLGLVVGPYTFINASVDNLFLWSFGRHFSLGAGLQLGGAFAVTMNFLHVSPVVMPAVLKFGEWSQHQVALTGSVVVLSNIQTRVFGDYPNYRYEYYTLAGALRFNLGYTYFF
jgi:hypothetical protein